MAQPGVAKPFVQLLPCMNPRPVNSASKAFKALEHLPTAAETDYIMAGTAWRPLFAEIALSGWTPMNLRQGIDFFPPLLPFFILYFYTFLNLVYISS